MKYVNKYLKKLNRIEFIITYACTGKCKHCSEGDHSEKGAFLDSSLCENVLLDISKKYNIDSVMTFGGEPLLYPEAVFSVHSVAEKLKIPVRQLITNGYFTKKTKDIIKVADALSVCGVNDILLSVDAFHQETIPLDKVIFFVKELVKRNLPVRLNPAWLVSRDNDNPYNIRTREILKNFKELGISEGEGNVIFPEGNALKYLGEYFDEGTKASNPYEENPQDLRVISIEPCGTLLGKSLYKESVLNIVDQYKP